MEERKATEEVFRGDPDTNKHFVHVGHALGLVRIKDLHLGKLEDLRNQVKEPNTNERTSKPEPDVVGGHATE